jgi:3-dehydroquinate synthase
MPATALPFSTGESSESVPERLRVELGNRSYDILIGRKLLARTGALIRPLLKTPRLITVTDENVAPLLLETVRTSCESEGIAFDAVILPAGEATKQFASLERLMDALLDAQPDRNTTLLALGGGVIGDITGFAASILLRGVPFIQAPTTLLSQVDSSVGGKTGINTRHGKNLVGSFYQPRLVLADTDCLAQLPRREWLAGYAEVVKYGLIDRPAFYEWLEQNGTALLGGDNASLTHAIRESCAAKAAIVGEDEKESGARALLNLGHTFGHALEAEAGYGGSLLHGEAVAIGMVQAFEFSAFQGLCPASDAERVKRYLQACGLPVDIRHLKPHWSRQDLERLVHHMRQDKKTENGKLTFILARGIGQSFIAKNVPESDVLRYLEQSVTLHSR